MFSTNIKRVYSPAWWVKKSLYPSAAAPAPTCPLLYPGGNLCFGNHAGGRRSVMRRRQWGGRGRREGGRHCDTKENP